MSQPPPPGQPYPGPPYAQPPPKKRNTTLWVVLAVVLGIIILCCGGGLALFGFAIWEEEQHDTPSTVTEGEPFEHDDFAVSGGWQVVEGEFLNDFDIEGLTVTNNGLRRSALLTFRFYRGDEVLSEGHCNSNEIQEGETSRMDCYSLDNETYTEEYDEVRVSDRW